ncbi:MAG: hypothetical protein O7H41_12450, partial [Planctomycetota bacterium]|nr:hypothetical protein [Planctomycetota bacterium]
PRPPPGAGAGGRGGGGGAIRRPSGANVTINGTIVADGGAGGNADRTSSGGGGSGGAIHIQAGGSILLNGSGPLLGRAGPAGTASGSGSRSGGDGGQGRIRLQDSDGIASGSGAIDPAPAQGALKIDVGAGFRASASILEPRQEHSAVLLRDGYVLITGAVQDTSGTSSSLGQIYDPKAEMVASAGLMFQDYSQRSITLLPSGDVLIAGGIKNQVSVKFDMELYRHATETFSTLPALERARGGHTATLLPNGLVLIAGGGTNTAEVYDWVLEDSTLLSSTMATARSGHSATLSGDGRLLIAGGEDGGGSFSSTEWFDISMQTFVPGPPMNMARAYHVAALLPTGEILVAGGEDGLLALDTAEIFDPILNSFTLLTATLTGPRTRIGSAGYLPDGTILLVGGGGQSADIFDPWIRIFRGVQGLMTAARIDHTVTKLSSDQVLIIGGLDPVSNAVLDSTEIFTLEPRAGEKTFLVTGAPGTVRDLASGTRLSDGRVLLAGGNDGGASVASSETYDLVAGSFQPDGAMGTPREGHAAVLLPTGEVLVMGGIDTASGVLNTAETYDPFSGSWTPTASLMDLPRFQPEAILLWSGAVFVCGGTDGVSALEMSEVYDPLTRTFTPSGNMMAKRLGHAVAPLPDGRILVTGGEDDIPLVLSSAEIYDPIIGFFSPTGGMGSPRRGHSSTLLPDGRVLVVGGASDGTTVEGSTEIYDFTTGLFSPGPPMGSPRFGHTAVLLPNGTVLIAGGKATISGLDEVTSEVYSPVADQFLPVGSMSFGRSAFPLVLMGDGRVLAVGAGGGADLYTP